MLLYSLISTVGLSFVLVDGFPQSNILIFRDLSSLFFGARADGLSNSKYIIIKNQTKLTLTFELNDIDHTVAEPLITHTNIH